MKPILRRLTLAGVALTSSLAIASGAAAEDSGKVVVGILNCQESGGWGLVLGSSHTVKCVFTNGANHSEPYKGRISKLGVDIGYQHSGVIIWTVLAPTADVAAGALSGNYAGATGGASVGVGTGANVLLGGSLKSITLQPVSFEGLTGVNVAGGVEALSLDAKL
jgi:hypothetical protein